MQSPRHPGVHFFKTVMVAKNGNKNKKWWANDVFRRLMLFCYHLLLLMQPISTVADTKPPPKTVGTNLI